MANPRKTPLPSDKPLPPPSKTLEGRENQMVALAFDLAERRLHEGSASAQEVVHFLRLGSTKERLEQEKLRHENEVLQTRVKEMESRKSSEELYAKALAAMRGYAGIDPISRDGDDQDVY